MSTLARLIDNNDIAACDDADLLLGALKCCAADILRNISRMAAILRRLDELDVAVEIDHALLPYIRMIANGSLSAECFIAVSGDPRLLELAPKLPPDLQKKIATNEPFKLLEANGSHREVGALDMSREQLDRAFSGGHLRTEQEQAEYLQRVANRSANRPVVKTRTCVARSHHSDPPATFSATPVTSPQPISGKWLSEVCVASQQQSELSMSAEDAAAVANRVMLHLYRGSIELAREALEDGWRSHVAEHMPLPVGEELLEESLVRVISDVRLLNMLEEAGIDTIGALLYAPDDELLAIPNLGEMVLAKLKNLCAGLRLRAGADGVAKAPLTNKPIPHCGTPKNVVKIVEPEMRAWCESETLRLLPFILSIVRKLKLPHPEDDLVQEGAMACFKALPHFDPNRGLKVETYIAHRIRGGILDYIRKPGVGYLTSGGGRTGRKEHIVSIDQVAYTSDSDHELTVASFLEDETAIDPSAVRGGERWAGICKGFSDRERIILQEYFAHGKTMREIGESFDLSESRVSQLMSGLLSRLRELDAKDGRVRESCA